MKLSKVWFQKPPRSGLVQHGFPATWRMMHVVGARRENLNVTWNILPRYSNPVFECGYECIFFCKWIWMSVLFVKGGGM